MKAGAGVMAVAALGSFALDGTASHALADETISIATEASATCNVHGILGSDEVRSSQATLNYPVSEEWDEEKHKPELHNLIVKKASRPGSFSTKDAERLAVLQRMRRDILPSAMSYEEFIRDQDCKAELLRLTNELLAFEFKYGAHENAKVK